MPQMSPLSWMLLYLMFSATLIIFSSMNFFNYNPNINLSNSLNSIKNYSMTWKW